MPSRLFSLLPFLAFAMIHTSHAAVETDWHDVTAWPAGIEGRAFATETRERPFDRLPSSAKGKVDEAIWKLSRDSSGMVARFSTNATAILIKYELTKRQLADVNITAMGRSGVDLYARDSTGCWRWVAASQPTAQTVKAELVSGIELLPDNAYREYALYLPLLNPPTSLSIGVPAKAHFTPLAPRKNPIVFYGTSINHGYSASRPGMTHIAMLGRRLDIPVVDLGFSGIARMDLFITDQLGKIDAAVYVIDCLPNMNPEMVAQRTEPFVRRLRELRPDTPIVLVEDRRKPNEWIKPAQRKFHDDNHAALRKAYGALQKSGVANLYYIPGDDLLGDDSDGTIDSSHPNDLGFFRQANAMEPLIRKILGL